VRAALATIVAASAAPYGYTVTLWSSGAVLMGSHGVPNVAEVFAFLAGALAGFGLMALVAHGSLGQAGLLDDADRVLAGTLHVMAVGGAVGAVALLAQIHSWEAWPLSAFAATALYLLMASLELTIVAIRRRRPVRSDLRPVPGTPATPSCGPPDSARDTSTEL
jgi:hypothetical protein